MKLKILLYCIFCLGIFIDGMAQDNQAQWVDVVNLINGSKLKGKIIRYDYDTELVLQLVTGAEVVLSHSQIKSVTQENVAPGAAKSRKAYEFKESGFYNETNLTILAVDSRTDDLPALGINTVFGKQFNRNIGAGLGIGVEQYAISTHELIYSLFGEARGYFLSRNVSPYYTIRMGYGIPGRNDQLLSSQGGLYISPSLGYRIGGSEHLNFTMAVGYSFQRANYTFQGNTWLRETIEERIQYKRLFVRLGMLF